VVGAGRSQVRLSAGIANLLSASSEEKRKAALSLMPDVLRPLRGLQHKQKRLQTLTNKIAGAN
jgi:hypothetical protein